MNAQPCEFSATRERKAPVAVLFGAVACLLSAGNARAAPPAAAPVPPVDMAAGEASAPYPSFTQVPPAPKDIPTPAQWKARVVATRLAGARLSRQIAALSWTPVGDPEAWAAEQRAAGAPPAQITPPLSADLEAKLAQLRAQVSRPPRSK